MRDLAWWSMWFLAMVAIDYLGELREERCVDHGYTWVREPGCKQDWCDRSSKGCAK